MNKILIITDLYFKILVRTVFQFWEKRLPHASFIYLRGRFFSQCKCHISEKQGILAVGSQEIPQSHTAQQTSHKRFIGKCTRAWLYLLRKSSKELSRRQAYVGFLGGRVFQVKLEIGKSSTPKSELGLFNLKRDMSKTFHLMRRLISIDIIKSIDKSRNMSPQICLLDTRIIVNWLVWETVKKNTKNK